MDITLQCARGVRSYADGAGPDKGDREPSGERSESTWDGSRHRELRGTSTTAEDER